jgi:putative aldouronate transport system permease protein
MSQIQRRHIRVDASTLVLRVISYVLITLFSIACILPFIIVISSSFSTEKSIMKYGFPIIPRELTLVAYKTVFEYPDIVIGSYAVTVGLTVVGTAIGLFLTAMGGYALQRPDFVHRNKISFYIYFTTLFSGGVVPFYIMMIRYFGLKDNYLSVLLPALMSPWLVILMKSFTKSIPHSITESAKMDGAGDFLIFIRLILPMSKPALATVGLFTALGYWNEWYNALLFLSPNMRYRPLQLFLYTVITRADFIRNSAAAANIPPQDVPSETMKMATAVVATGPVILFYPFVQRYFIKGITIGAVTG